MKDGESEKPNEARHKPKRRRTKRLYPELPVLDDIGVAPPKPAKRVHGRRRKNNARDNVG